MAGTPPGPNRIQVRQFGLRGVNVDLNPLELAENELRQAVNMIADVAAGQGSLRKRPGWVAASTSTTAGVVYGGADLPLADLFSGTHFVYLGRGPTS